MTTSTFMIGSSRYGSALLSASLIAIDAALRDLVLEDEAAAALARLRVDLHVPVLSPTAGLAHEASGAVGASVNCFAVGHLRLAHVGVDPELPCETVDNDLQVQLTHPGDDVLAGLLVGV